MAFSSGEELIKECAKQGISIGEYALLQEMKLSNLSRQQVMSKMKATLEVMKDSIGIGINSEEKSVSGFIGGDAKKMKQHIEKNETLCGDFLNIAMARSLAVAEVNACMGRIVAAPTAGSCGVVPSSILTAGEKLNKTEEEIIMALFATTGVGMIIAKNATVAGAEGGCQAEVGSAAAMSAAAIVEMMGGTPKMALDAAAMVLKNVEGLVCDPIAGLVEIPCAKRNMAGTVLALTMADVAMAKVESKIPFDDALEAMYKVGKSLPSSLRETAMGGLAVTKTGIKYKEKIYGK